MDSARSRPKSAPTGQRLGARLVQLHRAAQPHAARFQNRQRGNAYETTCGTRSTGGSIAWCPTSARTVRRFGRASPAEHADSTLANVHAEELVADAGASQHALAAARPAVVGGTWKARTSFDCAAETHRRSRAGRRNRPEPAGVTHALWTLHGLGVLDGGRHVWPRQRRRAVAALKHPVPPAFVATRCRCCLRTCRNRLNAILSAEPKVWYDSRRPGAADVAARAWRTCRASKAGRDRPVAAAFERIRTTRTIAGFPMPRSTAAAKQRPDIFSGG